MYKANTIVLISVDYIDARQTCERIEGEFIEDFNSHHDIQDVPTELYETYHVSDFMGLVNDEVLDILTEHFITFVETK